MDPDGLDPQVRKIYDIPGLTISLDLTRQRRDTGLTFSREALDEYATTVATFVTTRVMRYWNETEEPPVRMTTLVTVGLDHQHKVEHAKEVEKPDLVEAALDLANTILMVHEHVAMDTAEDKALHAKACEQFHDSIKVIKGLHNG